MMGKITVTILIACRSLNRSEESENPLPTLITFKKVHVIGVKRGNACIVRRVSEVRRMKLGRESLWHVEGIQLLNCREGPK